MLLSHSRVKIYPHSYSDLFWVQSQEGLSVSSAFCWPDILYISTKTALHMGAQRSLAVGVQTMSANEMFSLLPFRSGTVSITNSITEI